MTAQNSGRNPFFFCKHPGKLRKLIMVMECLTDLCQFLGDVDVVIVELAGGENLHDVLDGQDRGRQEPHH